MIAAARKASRTYVEHSTIIMRCSTRIAAFADSFAPFFDIMAVFVQIKAEWLAIFWGTILLVLKVRMTLSHVSIVAPQLTLTGQLGSNLVTFLERVTSMFEELSIQLPQYRDWHRACRQTPFSRDDKDLLGSSLAHIYGDFVEFTLHVYFMFTKRSKGKYPQTSR